MLNTPYVRLAPAPLNWSGGAGDLHRWDWSTIPVLPPMIRVDGSGPAEQQTSVRVCADAAALYIRFDCDDRDIWATYTRRDDPIYDEEVVELFLSAGPDTPTHYYEFEISPAGVLFDARIENSTGRRIDILVDTSWDCDSIRWQTGRSNAARQWWAVLVIPWASLTDGREVPSIWRANFYRIERPHGADPEFSCWSPTMTDPADFHKPEYFGSLEMVKSNVNR